MADLSIFSARLKNARVMKGLSMDELCSAMGNIVSKMAISKYENGQLAPNSGVIIALSKALSQPVDYFFRPFTVQVDSVRRISFQLWVWPMSVSAHAADASRQSTAVSARIVNRLRFIFHASF
jgi:transcriptional regulator with XRE-family HTH domain